MPAPGLKEMSRSRELKLGHFIVEFATPGIGQILKAAGCDFALFDTEHSGFGFETIKDRAAEDTDDLDFTHGRTLATNYGVLVTNGTLHDRILAAISNARLAWA